MRENKGLWIYPALMMSVLALGALIGSVYAAGMKEGASDELTEYLSVFFNGEMRRGGEIFFASFADNIKLFLVIFTAGFFRFGAVFVLGAACAQGFVSGFTAAALVKLMGRSGFLLNLSGGIAAVIFLTDVIFFGAYSLRFGLRGGKRDKRLKKNYILLSLGAITIFGIASLCDGYITTIFMKMIVTRM